MPICNVSPTRTNLCNTVIKYHELAGKDTKPPLGFGRTNRGATGAPAPTTEEGGVSCEAYSFPWGR